MGGGDAMGAAGGTPAMGRDIAGMAAAVGEYASREMVGRCETLDAAAGGEGVPLTATRHDSSGGRGFPATLPIDQPALSTGGVVGVGVEVDGREAKTSSPGRGGSRSALPGAGAWRLLQPASGSARGSAACARDEPRAVPQPKQKR